MKITNILFRLGSTTNIIICLIMWRYNNLSFHNSSKHFIKSRTKIDGVRGGEEASWILWLENRYFKWYLYETMNRHLFFSCFGHILVSLTFFSLFTIFKSFYFLFFMHPVKNVSFMEYCKSNFGYLQKVSAKVIT